MKKKYIKIIKHLYKNLQKKDELRNEFEKTSELILLFSFGISFSIFFAYFFLTSGHFGVSFLSSLLLSFGMLISLLISKIKIFNNLVSQKLSKYNLFNLYGRNSTFDEFISNILLDIIESTDKENIKPYIKEILHIINSIQDIKIKNNLKMIFIEKMEVDIEPQLTNLTEDKTQKENIIKIEHKSIVVNN